MGELGKTGELGEPGKLGTESGAERWARFLRGEEGAGYARYVCAEAGFCEMGHAGKGICEVGMTGEPLVSAQKKKQVCDVCGAPSPSEPPLAAKVPHAAKAQTPAKIFPTSEGFSV